MKGRGGGCRVDVLIVWTAVHVDVARISGGLRDLDSIP
jgi:hypothetical protein